MLKNTKKGFTLIELIMVMIILGIMAAVAIPRYLETIEKSEVAAEDAGKQYYGRARELRSEQDAY